MEKCWGKWEKIGKIALFLSGKCGGKQETLHFSLWFALRQRGEHRSRRVPCAGRARSGGLGVENSFWRSGIVAQQVSESRPLAVVSVQKLIPRAFVRITWARV